MTAIAARARGLGTTILAADALAELERVRDLDQLAAALGRGLVSPGEVDAETIDRLVRDRVASDLAILARWTDRLAPLELDEDRRSLRALVRGLAGAVPARRRLAGTVPTARLSRSRLAALGDAVTIDELVALLARYDHPLAQALAESPTPIDPLAIELALARRFADLARPYDHAMRDHVEQVIDAENAAAALQLAARGQGVDVDAAFVAGGRLVDRGAFVTAAAAPIDTAREVLARALAHTPLPRALFASAPAALEDAALAWQLQTQARLRRIEPLGLAPAVYVVLCRRDEARHLRRAAWRIALGGAA